VLEGLFHILVIQITHCWNMRVAPVSPRLESFYLHKTLLVGMDSGGYNDIAL
jgi:hypothetical protein